MTQITLEEVTNEVRTEFHIPPFFKDDDLKRLVNQSDAYLSMLVDGINYGSDLVARDLLKYRVYYAYNGKINQFDTDFAHNILTWQFSKINGVTNDGDTNVQ